jgi:hypothetical protein
MKNTLYLSLLTLFLVPAQLCAKPSIEAINNYIRFFMDENEETDIEAELGDTPLPERGQKSLKLGNDYLKGENGVKINYEKARDFFIFAVAITPPVNSTNHRLNMEAYLGFAQASYMCSKELAEIGLFIQATGLSLQALDCCNRVMYNMPYPAFPDLVEQAKALVCLIQNDIIPYIRE